MDLNKKPLVKNAADENQVREAEKKEKLEQDLAVSDLKFLLATAQFRRFVWRYLGFCRVFHQVFTGNSETFFNDGKRVVGLKLLDEVTTVSPDAYMQMLKENKGD